MHGLVRDRLGKFGKFNIRIRRNCRLFYADDRIIRIKVLVLGRAEFEVHDIRNPVSSASGQRETGQGGILSSGRL